MQGTVELHGAKFFIQVDPATPAEPFYSNDFLPGDVVTLTNPPILVYRKPQPALAIVRPDNTLYLANFGPNVKYSPKVDLGFQPSPGTRIVLWLNANGTVVSDQIFSADPLDDIRALTCMYSLTTPRSLVNLEDGCGHSLYTIEGIVNHDDLDTFTIDPKSSVDFDDAITVDIPNNTVYVHIVDIAGTSHLNLHEWRRLRERCLTLYMANEHTEHLLDSNTASDTLSLVAGQSRQVITAKITLDGCKVTKYDIYRSTITVKRRWNYEEVAIALHDNSAPEAIKYLAALTEDRNSVVKYNVNLPSLRLHVDTSTGKIADLYLENTNDPSHGLVATAMILANLVVSKHLAAKAVPIPSRFHKKLAGMLPPNFTPSGIPTVDSFITIKKFARANYSLDEKGHFGLDLTDYVHFTSPMRRYADVLVHLLLSGWQPTPESIQEDIDTMNHRQNVVRQCQDLYEQWKVVRYLMDSPSSSQRDVYITNVMPAGLIWFMPDLSLNGFAHVSTLAPPSPTRWVQEFGSESMKRGITEIRVGQGFKATVDSIDPTTFVVKLIIHTDQPV